MVIFVVVAIILEFVARSAVAIVVVVARRHRRRRRHHRHPSPSLSSGWLLRSPPAPRSLSRGVSREKSRLARSLLQGVQGLVRSDWPAGLYV